MVNIWVKMGLTTTMNLHSTINSPRSTKCFLASVEGPCVFLSFSSLYLPLVVSGDLLLYALLLEDFYPFSAYSFETSFSAFLYGPKPALGRIVSWPLPGCPRRIFLCEVENIPAFISLSILDPFVKIPACIFYNGKRFLHSSLCGMINLKF